MKQSLAAKKWIRVLIPSLLITIWLLVAGIGGPYFGKIGDVASNDQSTLCVIIFTQITPAVMESGEHSSRIYQAAKIVPITLTVMPAMSFLQQTLHQVQATFHATLQLNGVTDR